MSEGGLTGELHTSTKLCNWVDWGAQPGFCQLKRGTCVPRLPLTFRHRPHILAHNVLVRPYLALGRSPESVWC